MPKPKKTIRDLFDAKRRAQIRVVVRRVVERHESLSLDGEVDREVLIEALLKELCCE